MIVFEALHARHGDALLLHDGASPPGFLWAIDGGPAGVFKRLLDRIRELDDREEGAFVSLAMVSHIDDDHINGMGRLVSQVADAGRNHKPRPVGFGRFWFNSFSRLLDASGLPDAAPAGATPAAVVAAQPAGWLAGDHDAAAILQSVPQGESLTAELVYLGLADNRPLDRAISAPWQGRIDGVDVTILGPRQNRLDDLRREWAAATAIADRRAREAALQDLFLPEKKLDTSIPNLSSIVLLAERGGRRILLTGDARGDDIVKAWREEPYHRPGPIEVDILKVPHHGSDRGITPAFLETFPARHYVFSADGAHDNPDARVVEAIVATQDRRDITLHFTNAGVVWSKPYRMDTTGDSVTSLDALIEILRRRPGTRASYAFRDPASPSLRIELD